MIADDQQFEPPLLACVCVCVCVKERERDYNIDRKNESERTSVCVSLRERERIKRDSVCFMSDLRLTHPPCLR